MGRIAIALALALVACAPKSREQTIGECEQANDIEKYCRIYEEGRGCIGTLVISNDGSDPRRVGWGCPDRALLDKNNR